MNVRENRLMEVRYQDSAQGIMLTGYADTVIADPQYKLVGIRFGGYPEMVQGISAAICGGATVTVSAEEQTYLWNEPGEIEKVQAVLTRLCDDPLRTRLEELLAKAAEMRDAFDTAPDNGKAKALVQLRTEFAGLYREWQALDVGATTDEQHRQAADALNTLEEMSRKAHEACAFTPVPLAQLAVLQSAA